MSTGLAIVVGKLLRDERRRSDARVAALAEMAAEPEPREFVAPLFHRTAAPMQRDVSSRPAPIASKPTRRHANADDLELRSMVAVVAGVGELFSQPERTSPWRRRLAAIGAMAAVILVIVVASTSSPTPTTVAGPPSTSNPPAATAPAPLELLSLHYARQEQSLTITGLVQNPRGSLPISRVAATVLVFGPDGAFLSSGRAPLDFSTLAPGDESPFVITVAVTGQVERYRIGFRSEDGRVLAHIDKRGPDAVARK